MTTTNEDKAGRRRDWPNFDLACSTSNLRHSEGDDGLELSIGNAQLGLEDLGKEENLKPS
jgi:hypothetical protein